MMDVDKFDTLVHYICARCGDPSTLGATKLNKILWYSDSASYLTLGRPISGATYIKRQFGPVPRDIMQSRQRLANSGAMVEREALYHGYPQTQFIALCRPNLTRFTAEEISIVDQIIDIVCNDHTAASISALTHNHVWEAAEIGEEIPLYTVFASRPGEIDENDLIWAKNEIFRVEREMRAF
jgi:Protein of unknown function (DUF4065)